MQFHPHWQPPHHFELVWVVAVVLLMILIAVLSMLSASYTMPLPSGTDWFNQRNFPSMPTWPN
jgi:hypothetical protein